MEDPCCGYLTEEDCKYYIYTMSRRNSDSFASVTLDQMLKGKVIPLPTRRQRYALSLTLASSFLQFLDTPWLPVSWKKTDIVFFADPRNIQAFALDRPHLTRNSLSAPAPQTTHSTQIGNAASLSRSLDQLGIVLLELCFGKTLEQQPCREKWPSGQNEVEQAGYDVLAARDWQYEVEEEAGLEYFKAVTWCLGGIRPDRWRQDMLWNVVEPLQRCRDFLQS
jgi:hypothetical protein